MAKYLIPHYVIRSEDWNTDTRDSNSDKDRDHACGDLCAGIVLVMRKEQEGNIL